MRGGVMEQPRPEKVAVVGEVRDRMNSATAVLVSEYRGLSVSDMSTLRRSLRPVGGGYTVYKNTLVRRAADEAGLDFGDLLVGPNALTFAETTPEGERGDVVAIAKALKDFAKTNPNLVLKGGILDGKALDAAELNALAELEPREVLLAKLAGLIAAPMVQFAGLLQAIPRNFAYGLKALIDEGGAAGAPQSAPVVSEEPAPAADDSEEAAPEAPADDAEAATESDTSAETEQSDDASAEAPESES
ncbi:MAG: 50S ribosomal protein L10 [Acidimicrobiales bacterium]